MFDHLIEKKINNSRWKISKQIFSLCTSVLLLSCGYNHEPIIQSLIADPDIIGTGGIVILTCNASDEEGADSFKDDKLTYTWDATGGTILQDYGGSTASWTAPEISGIFSISCIVEDPDHGSDIAMINVTVQ